MKTLSLVLAVSSLMLVLAPPARACAGLGDGCGGLALDWDQPYYMPGEVATGRAAQVWHNDGGRRYGTPIDGPFQVYLRPLGRNMRKPAAEDPSAIPLGYLVTEQKGSTARASFVVPDVPGGQYTVSHCNAGCTKTLGDLYDSSIRVIAGVAEERRYLSGLFDELRNLSYREGARSFRRLRKLSKTVDAKERELLRDNYELSAQVRDLEARVDGLRRKVTGTPPPDQRLSLAAAGGASLLAALALHRRKKGEIVA